MQKFEILTFSVKIKYVSNVFLNREMQRNLKTLVTITRSNYDGACKATHSKMYMAVNSCKELFRNTLIFSGNVSYSVHSNKECFPEC